MSRDELMRAAHTEAAEDLERLITAAECDFDDLQDPVLTATFITQGLLDGESWGRIELASVLGVALVRLIDRKPTS